MRHLPAIGGRLGFVGGVLAEPFESFLAAAALISGVSVLIGTSHPGSLASQLSPWVLRAWGASLSAGGALTMISRGLLGGAHSVRDLVRALRLEQMGMTIFATTAGMYAIAIMALGREGLAAGPIIIGWSGACTVRAWIIRAERRALPSEPAG